MPQKVFDLNAVAGPDFVVEHGFGTKPRTVSAYDAATQRMLSPKVTEATNDQIAVTITEALGLRRITLILAA